MNLFDLDSDIITMNVDGKDMEMRHSICFGKEYDKWLVSRCGIVWSIMYHRVLPGTKQWSKKDKNNQKRILGLRHVMSFMEEDWWGDSSGRPTWHKNRNGYQRDIAAHKMIMDTWAPLYDNPPEGIVWEEWEIVRDLPTVYNHISKTVIIDHIDDDPTNNHLNNLRRVTSWDNNSYRKAKGI